MSSIDPALVDRALTALLEEVHVLAERDLGELGALPRGLVDLGGRRHAARRGVDLGDLDVGVVEVFVLGDREDTDPLDESQVVGVHGGKPVDEVLQVRWVAE